MKAAKRMNPVVKNVPVTVELMSWIKNNFVGGYSIPDSQRWPSLMIGCFCLRISEVGNLLRNDLVFQSTDDGYVLTIRIRKSKTVPEGQWSLRSLLPTGNLMCPTSACVEWLRIRGWDSESDSKLPHWIRSRLVGVLKFASLSNNMPVGTNSAHSLRSGGTTTIFHAGYCLLDVKERGRWKSSGPHGYLWYDIQTMRHVGKRMAVATGFWFIPKLYLLQ